jgi:hypothetical protein
MRAFSDGEFSTSAALFVRNCTRNVRAPDVLSFVTSSDARSSNSRSQPDRISSREKLILLTSRIRAHAGPLDVGPLVTPEVTGFSEAEDCPLSPSLRIAILYHIIGPRVSAIRACPRKPVDRNSKKPLGQGPNLSSSLIFGSSPGLAQGLRRGSNVRRATAVALKRCGNENLDDRCCQPLLQIPFGTLPHRRGRGPHRHARAARPFSKVVRSGARTGHRRLATDRVGRA